MILFVDRPGNANNHEIDINKINGTCMYSTFDHMPQNNILEGIALSNDVVVINNGVDPIDILRRISTDLGYKVVPSRIDVRGNTVANSESFVIYTRCITH